MRNCIAGALLICLSTPGVTGVKWVIRTFFTTKGNTLRSPAAQQKVKNVNLSYPEYGYPNAKIIENCGAWYKVSALLPKGGKMSEAGPTLKLHYSKIG